MASMLNTIENYLGGFIMGIDYVMGFRDATQALELETNRIISAINKSTREEMSAAIDAFIASVYVLKLQYETMEEEMLEEMNELFDYEYCDMMSECEEFNKNINQLFKEEF